ncbi:hypothetical protein P4S83_17725 [Aneurinibacillus thermoaerophilus]|uniref:phage tail sheath N-terminal beta-sandwich domain-containing protein n=1 Tax=Aneurinibacillus thermoaerophilus TaxID=143495 RepID=UPI002E21081C|nr:hypothetical protein [Aneurinibacillus thermoaerophilus]MED0765540.1 hypothetical protein [Aneurinibacillus thermoaerophilus]
MKPFVEGRHEAQAGVFSRFDMVVQNAVAEGARGIIAMPIKADWGPVKEFVELSSFPDAKEIFGEGKTANLLRVAFWGNPLAVKAYRLASANLAKAKLTLDTIEIEALYAGARGNSFQVTIRPTLANPAKKELILTENALQLQSITFASVDELVTEASDSSYIRVKKIGETMPVDVNGQALTGGHSGEDVTTTEYSEFLNALAAEYANRFVLDGVKDAAIKQMCIQYEKDQRQVGKLIKFDTGGMDALTIDYYGVSNVIQWAKKDGVKYEPEDVAVYVCAAAASCPLNESLALKTTPFDEVQKLNNVELNQKIREGNLCFIQEGRIVKFSTPVNTMTTVKNLDSVITLDPEADEDAVIRTLQKIKIIEAADYIFEAQDKLFQKPISQANTEARRLATAQEMKDKLLAPLAAQEVIENGTYDCYPNPEYHGPNPTKKAYKDEQYYVTVFKLLDAAEKIYNQNKTF